MTLTQPDLDAIEAVIWAHPQGVAYLDKIARMELSLPAWLDAHFANSAGTPGGGYGGGSWPRPWKQQQPIEDTEALYLMGMI